jgi:hypothetical protein
MKERKLTLSHNLDIVAMQVKALLGGDVWGADDVQMSAPTGAEPRGGGGRDARPALQTSTKHNSCMSDEHVYGILTETSGRAGSTSSSRGKGEEQPSKRSSLMSSRL